MTLSTTANDIDFSELHAKLQRYIDDDILPCVATLTMQGTDVLDYTCLGYMDVESKEPLRPDAIFKAFSNTKIITSVAMMQLVEQGACSLDDTLTSYAPAFERQVVLRSDAQSTDDTEPVQKPITIRHLLSHSSGLSYGFIDPTGLIDRTYLKSGLNVLAEYDEPLEQLLDRLAGLPLASQPGTEWRYSLSTDVIGRLVEIISGQRFDDYLAEHIFAPLGMVDTGFCVPESKHDRVITMYAPADMLEPMTPGLTQAGPHRAAPTEPPVYLSGGGGLWSTVEDYVTFMRMLINGGEWNGTRILTPETVELMRTNQLAKGVYVEFPMWAMPGTVFGLGLALKSNVTEGDGDHASSVDEYHWGGMAGTHSWMSPSGVSGFNMTQVMPSFWHPFSHDCKHFAYTAVVR